MIETTEILKPGLPVGEHSCEFIRGGLETDPDEGVFEYKQICRLCGKVEHIIRPTGRMTFENIYAKFYSKEGSENANTEI